MNSEGFDPIAAMFAGKKDLLTADELSDILRPSPKTLYAWAAQGKIPYVRIGGMILFPTKQIIEWVRERNYQPRPTYRNGRELPPRA